MSAAVAAHVVGFDDAPFARTHRGDVAVIGTVYAGTRLDGVLRGKVRRDGRNATQVVSRLVRDSRFFPQLHLIMLQGIALAGFNVVDIHALHTHTGLPVLVVMRHAPSWDAIRNALLQRVPGGRRKWQLIEAAGAVEHLANVYVQRAGISAALAQAALERFQLWGHIPEPLRAAHLIAGGITTGESRGGA